MTSREFDELSAGRALHALTPDEEREMDKALIADPTLANAVDVDRATAAQLAETVAEIVPPPALRETLLALIQTTPQLTATQDADTSAADDIADEIAAIDEEEAEIAAEEAASVILPSAPALGAVTRGRWGQKAWFALAACFVLLLGIGGAVAVVSQQVAPAASVVALEQIQDASDAQTASAEVAGGGEATLHWSASLDEAVVVTDGVAELASDQTYELWFVRDGAPISAGTFDAEGGDATALLAGAVQSGDLVAITVEQSGGSPTGAPTTEPIVAIATA